MKTHTSIDSIFKSTIRKWKTMIHSTVEKIIYNIRIGSVVPSYCLVYTFLYTTHFKTLKEMIVRLKIY